MQIVMYCPGMPFNGATLDEGKSLGGSESAAYYMARELARLENQVTLFTAISREEAGCWEGVRYLSMGEVNEDTPLGMDFEWYASTTPHDCLLIQRIPEGFQRPFASKVNLWWSHDLALKRQQPRMALQLWNVDRILAVSAFHKNQIAETYCLPKSQIEILPNGVDQALFAAIPDPSSQYGNEEAERKLSNGILTYTSRPERGLELLVGVNGLMERLLESAPELKLKVAGYENTTPNLRNYYEYLWKRCLDLPNVELLGPLSKKELADLLRSAWLHVYPANFEEVSCITVMEAQSAGTPVLASRLAALPETLQDGGALFLDPDPETLPEEFEKQILSLKSNPGKWKGLHRKALQKAGEFNWESSAKKLVDLVKDIFEEKCSSPVRLAHHLIRHSDIFACKKLLEKYSPEKIEGLGEVSQELENKYSFVETGEYKQHYEAIGHWHIDENIDQGHGDPERILAMPRFRVVAELVGRLPEGSRVLDYACGQGHFTMAMAEQFPQVSFHGVDISSPEIEAGKKHLLEKGLPNVKLEAAEAEALTDQYDLIMGCEVLEHVAEPWGLAELLETHLSPGGMICFTVPYGPWEAVNYETVPFRSHIHHLERADLLRIFGHKPGYKCLAVPAEFNSAGEPLGAYRVTYNGGGDPAGEIDLASKLKRQAPRETLSVCMVCKDDGKSLARTLESIRPIANQIIIGIDGDPDQKGLSWQIGRMYGAECFSIDSPLEIGFDAARNLTLEKANSDWVLWIDDDEILEWTDRLLKYLRPNVYNGYAVKQHHYSLEPEGLIKTDFPCRIFRNNKGIRFFGKVHEHPETEINMGTGQVMLLPDVAICHNGYETEGIRRKRFKRNLPLMKLDRKEYPERILGKFLWIRDLAHLNRYALEKGYGIDGIIRSQAEEAVSLWRGLLKDGHIRMALDALPYYSESVDLIRGEGIQFEVSMGAACGGLGNLNGQPLSSVRGHFMNTDDIRLLTEKMLEEKTTVFEEKYF